MFLPMDEMLSHLLVSGFRWTWWRCVEWITVVSFHCQSDESTQELFANVLLQQSLANSGLNLENLSVNAGYGHSAEWKKDCNGCQCLKCGNVLQT